MFSGKIFGIGFHKTGTTSLGAALRILGYRVCGPIGVRDPAIKHNVERLTLPLVEQYDAFQDNPWPLLYQKLDRHFPGSKFILTLRSTDDWIASVVRHFGGQSTPMREMIYGTGDPLGHESLYVQRYEAHNWEVRNYFQDRRQDLLILRVTEGEGWEQLCPFLEAPQPSVDFPNLNSVRQRRFKTVRKFIRRVLSRPSSIQPWRRDG